MIPRKNSINDILNNNNFKSIDNEYHIRNRGISGLIIEDNEIISPINRFNDSHKILTEINPKLNKDKENFTKEINADRCITSYSNNGNIFKNSPRNYKRKLYYNEKYYKNNLSKNRNNHNPNNRDSIFYHYTSKMPKRPFQKCIEVPSEYIPKFKIEENNNDNNDNKETIDKNENLTMKSDNLDNCNKEKRNNSSELIDSKTLSCDKENQNNNNIKCNKYSEIEGDDRKKYFKSFFNNIRLYSKKSATNIKAKSINNNRIQNNIFISKKIKKIKTKINELNSENKKYVLDSKVNDFFISACYNNPLREQFLKLINEKRKQNPNKIIELVIPEFNYSANFMNPFPLMYQFNPYISCMDSQNFQVQSPMKQVYNRNLNNSLNKPSLGNNMDTIKVSNKINIGNPIQIVNKRNITIQDVNYRKKDSKQNISNYNNYFNTINTSSSGNISSLHNNQ